METTGAVLPPITIEASERIFTEFNDITKEGGQVLEGLSAREIDARLDTLHSSPTGVSKIAQQCCLL